MGILISILGLVLIAGTSYDIGRLTAVQPTGIANCTQTLLNQAGNRSFTLEITNIPYNSECKVILYGTAIGPAPEGETVIMNATIVSP